MPQSISADIIRICKGCGKEFHPHARKQFYCNADIEKQCVVCGQSFVTPCVSNSKVTCSVSCQAEYIKEKRVASASKLTKICKWCGKQFQPKSVRDEYCYDKHFQECVICGKSFEVDPRRYTNIKTCSKACQAELSLSHRDLAKEQLLMKQSLLARYGVENAMQIPGAIDRLKQTNLSRYGAEWYTQTEEYREKVKQTDLSKYGVEHHLQSEEVKTKRDQTVADKYGCENVFQSDAIKAKISSTIKQRYGVDNISQSQEIQDKITQNNLAKYGVKHPMMLPEYKEKVIQTNVSRYGRFAYTQQHISNIQDWYLFMNDPRAFIEDRYETAPRSQQLADDLGVDVSTVDVYLNKKDCKDCVRRAKSLMEEYVTQFLHDIAPELKIINNDRSVISPEELDIYIPELKLAIECNPTVTHNSSVGDPWGGACKHYKYHQNKSVQCQEKGIFLFHIFGSEWTYSRPIIESMIRNLLGKNLRKVYARKCVVKEIDAGRCREFLDANHRQGNVNSPIRLGLFLDDELVSVITFGKMRSSIGTDNTNLSDCWELVRFCSLLNTTVVGGADKLFKYFIRNYSPARIRSFSDKAHTGGGLYEKLGFVSVRESDPGYVWVDSRTDISYHRYSAQKQHIKQFLHDDNIDLSKTEKQIMEEHGFLQMYDCGTITWEWYCS